MKKTERGFKVYTQFNDIHNSEIRVESSSQVEAVWIFCIGTTYTEASPHLTKTQARRVAKALLRFAEGK